MASPRGQGTAAMPSNARQPKVYQIDFTAVASGKRIASTKRRVRWRFGFANPEALANGQTGTACRGEEHDVTLVWSVTSGKRLILADGQEVHYSNSRSGSMDFSWTMRGNHVLKVIAHASPPLSPTPGFRQYDFFVDGQSFFTFPKVYRLGLAQNDPRGHSGHHVGPDAVALADRSQNYTAKRSDSSGIASLEAPHNIEEEDAYLREAIKNSLKDSTDAKVPSSGASIGANAVGPHVNDPDLLIDFMGDDASASVAPPAPALPPSTSAAAPWDSSASAGGFAALPPSTTANVAAFPPSTNGYAASSTELVPSFAAPAPATSWGGVPQQPPQQAQPTYGQQIGIPPAGLVSPQPQATPSTLGLGSPPPDPGFFQSPPPAPTAQDPYSQGQAPVQQAPVQQSYNADPAASLFGAPAAGDPAGVSAPQPPNSFVPAPAPLPGQEMFAPAPGPDTQQTGGFAPAPPQETPNAFAAAPSQDTQNATGFATGPAPGAPEAPAPGADSTNAAPIDPAALTMNKLSGNDVADIFGNNNSSNAGGADAGQSGSLADQAYAKLANLDLSDLVSKKDVERANPFDMPASTTIGGQKSLADMKSENQKSGQGKEIMKSQSAALVVSNQQQGNWGGATSQYGMPGMGQQNQFGGQPQYGQAPMQQPQYGQQAPMQQPQYGQQPLNGQASMQQQPFGQQPPYGQAPMQQAPFGQQPPMQQQQQPQYGQQPPMQQQFGQPPQYGAAPGASQPGFYQ